MATLLILGFLAAAGIIGWAAILLLFRPNKRLRIVYHLCLAAIAIATYFTTYHYVHYMNANTKFHGWPIPYIVFQRDNPTAPWLDFVGPTILLAYPMNFILFALIPSIIALVLAWCLSPRPKLDDTSK